MATAVFVHSMVDLWMDLSYYERWDEWRLRADETRSRLGLGPLDPRPSLAPMWERLDRVVILLPPELDSSTLVPSNARYVGPAFEEDHGAVTWDSPWPTDDPNPLVVVSLGSTYMHHEEELQRTIDAVATLPVRALVTTGFGLDPDEVDAPAHVHLTSFVPHGAVLPHASMVLTHAGMSTVLTACAFGVPMLCMPLGRDQPEIAERVEALGAGRRIAKDATVEDIRTGIQETLASEELRAGARRMAEVIAEIPRRRARRHGTRGTPLTRLVTPPSGACRGMWADLHRRVVEPERGFEPRTYHLRGGCSTTELLRRRLPSLPNGCWHHGRCGGLHGRRDGPPSAMMRIMSTNGGVHTEGPVRRVMVGTDRSQTAERAVRWAASFAELYAADLHIVQVILPRNPADTEFGAAEATQARGAADELQTYAIQVAGERGKAHVVIDDDPAMAIVHATEEHAIDVLIVGNAGMAGRKEFLLGNVPNRISHNARCTVIIVNTAADGQVATAATVPRAPDVDPLERRGGRDRAAPGRSRREDRDRLRQARAEGAVRPSRRGRLSRQGPSSQAPALRARGAGTDVREDRADPVHAPRPAAAGVHPGAGHVAGRRAAAHRGAGRPRDGAGAGRPVGGRVRSHRTPSLWPPARSRRFTGPRSPTPRRS